MSNLEHMPATLGKINQELSSLKQATADVWSRLTKTPQKNLYSLMSEDIDDVSQKLRELNKQSRQLAKLNDAREKLATNGPTLFNSQYSIDKKTKKLKTQGIDAENTPEEQFIVDIKKQLANDSITKLKQQRPALIEQKGAEIGAQYKNRAQKISQFKQSSSAMVNFAQPKLELAKSFLKPGAELQAALSEVQSVLGLKNGDPRVAALRQQSLSMASSGHDPAEVVAMQKDLAKNGMSADQVLAQTPLALKGATPAEQMAVTVKGDNLDGDITKLFATWDTLRINLFEGQSSALRELTQTATGWLSTLNTWITDNPQLVNSLLGLALGVTGIIGGLGFLGGAIAPVLSGVSMLIAGASLLGTLFAGVGGIMGAAFALVGGPVIALIAVIAGIGFAVVKLWEPIKAFVGGVIDGFSAAMGPVNDAFSPFSAALGWITDLFKPLKFTQESLSNFSDIGKIVGAAIAEIFVTLNKAFSQIGEVFTAVRKGIDWVFSSDNNDDKSSSDAESSPLGNSLSPTGGTLDLYQPAKPNVGANLTDNRTTTQNVAIYATSEMDHNQLQNAVTQALNQQKWDEKNSSLSQYNFGGPYS